MHVFTFPVSGTTMELQVESICPEIRNLGIEPATCDPPRDSGVMQKLTFFSTAFSHLSGWKLNEN